MADEQEVQTETTEDAGYQEWLASLEEDEQPEAAAAEEEVEHEEVAAMKVAKAAAAKSDKLERDMKVGEIERKFDSGASEDAKHLVDIWRKGDETPEQLKKLMQLAEAKAAETAAENAPDPEAVEKAANEKAAEIVGAGPLGTGFVISPENETYKSLVDQVASGQDNNGMALLSLMAEDSKFIDAVLKGEPLTK